jgi:hypothetical protein
VPERLANGRFITTKLPNISALDVRRAAAPCEPGPLEVGRAKASLAMWIDPAKAALASDIFWDYAADKLFG